jgi:hypothetical protein
MKPTNVALKGVFGLSLRGMAALVLAVCLSTGCKSQCRQGQVLRDGLCHNTSQDAAVDAGDKIAVDGSAEPLGTGTRMQGASAAGTGVTKPTSAAVDPNIQWMCAKNAAGECTSCRQDADCPSHVCQQNYCMDCRDASQCGVAASCISNRCVPERKLSSLLQVSGGGQTNASGLKLQLSVGMPTPATSAAADGFKLSIEPGAGNF